MPLSAGLKSACFNAAIDAVYQCALEPSRWPEALQAIANVTDDFGAILIYGRDDGSFGAVCSPSMNAALVDYAHSWSTRDIRAIRTRERGYFVRRDVITDRDVLTSQEIVADPFYVDFLQRHGLKYFAAAMVSPDPRVEVALSIQRVLGRTEYTDEELEHVRLLGLHVERSLRLSMKLIDAELVKVGLGAALERIGIGVIALDSMERAVFSNAAALALIDDCLDHAVSVEKTGRTSDEYGGLSRNAIQTLLRRGGPSTDLDASPVLIPRAGSKRPLALYRIPVAETESISHRFLAQAQTILLLVDPEPGKPADPALLRDLLGLTLGEARVAALVGHGLSPREAAGRLGIAEETARTVLKAVFAKVNVSRQSELAALLARLALRNP
jgi:DNA-binding CsgD family transcriptional regulator